MCVIGQGEGVVLSGESCREVEGARGDDWEGQPGGGVASGDGFGAGAVGVPEGVGPSGEVGVEDEILGVGVDVEVVVFLVSICVLPFLLGVRG